jgi:anti-sigma regulatory factor (Ser/Thr protein kinase)
VDGAEQSDDITTIAIAYNGRKRVFNAVLNELDKALDWINGILEEAGCPSKTRNHITVVSEEVFVNITSYAYQGQNAPGNVTLTAVLNDKKLRLSFTDSGVAFNPLEQNTPDVKAGLADREIGGLGIYITRKWMDKLDYKREGSKNILSMEISI